MEEYCYYCEKDIQTVSDDQSGFFWLVNGKFAIVNHYGGKEAVCNECCDEGS